jgi:hypothetical protein
LRSISPVHQTFAAIETIASHCEAWLNRGGDPPANSALHIIDISRLKTETRTQARVAKRYRRGPFQGGGDPLPQTLHRE